ncbi:MAG: LytTR family DNA-binding domain-containing protein [Asticcacaulis sp.]
MPFAPLHTLLRVLSLRSAPLLSPEALLSLPLAGIVLGILGPFGSVLGMDLWHRIGHFVVTVSVIGGASLGVSYLVARWRFQGFWPLWAALLTDLVLAVPGVWVIQFSLWLFAAQTLAHVSPGILLINNVVLALIFRGLSLGLSWQRIRYGGSEGAETQAEERLSPSTDKQTEDPAPITDPDAALRTLLPRTLRGEVVLALSAEDHYLRVHTRHGEALVLMSLAAATDARSDGFRIHRSHWVTRAAIDGVEAERIRLWTGLTLPLSRHRKAAFREWWERAGA